MIRPLDRPSSRRKNALSDAAREQGAEQSAAIASVPETRPSLRARNWAGEPTPPDILPGFLNEMFRKMVEKTGKRCKAITDHVWVTPEHISLMCDRRIRAAFIHEENGCRLGNPGE